MEKIVIFSDFYYPDPGNRSRRVTDRALFLKKSGFDVVVVCPSNENVPHGDYSYEGISVIRVRPFLSRIFTSLDYKEYFKNFFFLSFLAPFLGFPRVLIPMLFRGFGLAPSIVYTMNNPVSLHLLGYLLSFSSSKWVAEMRDPIIDYEFSNRGWAGKLFDKFFEMALLSRADRVCMRSGLQLSVSKYSNVLRERFCLLPDYGVDLEDFDKWGESKLKNKNDKEVLLGVYAGGVYGSDFNAVFQALKLMNEECENKINANFYGPKHDVYEGNCFYKGYILYGDLLKVYENCDFVFVFDSSDSESSLDNDFIPSKLCELIATRKPVLYVGNLSSRTAKIVKENRIGIVSDGSIQSVISSMKKIRSMIKSNSFNYDYYEKNRENISNHRSEKEFLSVCVEVLKE